jgi:competence protein ComEA
LSSERNWLRTIAYAAAVALLIVAGVRYLDGRADRPEPPPVAVDEAGAEAAGSEEGAEEQVYVHVAGAVKRQGLYRLDSGSRVGAAIERAGGTRASADLSGVNLAGEVQDGQQVLVPERGEAPAAVSGTAPPSSASAGSAPGSATTGTTAPISLAQATPEQLDAGVDGIGPTLAARIIEFRDEQGSVASIEELSQVDGIGESRLGILRESLVP